MFHTNGYEEVNILEKKATPSNFFSMSDTTLIPHSQVSASSAAPTSAKRVPSLDGIRALSIGMVILCHFSDDMGWGAPFNLASLGVRIFFVISGFIITELLLKELDRDGSISFRRFYFRRTLRIFPPFYFYIAFMLLISAFGWSRLTLAGALPAITYTSNYWDRFESAGYTTSCTWSLSTEEQFYLIWPLLLSCSGRIYGKWVLVAIMILSPIARTLVYIHHGHPVDALYYFHYNADHLAAGCLLAFLRPQLEASAVCQRISRSPFIVLAPVLVFVANAQTNHPSLHLTIVPSLVNVMIAFCIFWAITHHGSIVGNWLNSRFMVWIGVLSYSLYLWQQPFMNIHSDKGALILRGKWEIIGSPFVSLPLMLGCAYLSYRLIERPSHRLREKLEARWSFLNKTRSPGA